MASGGNGGKSPIDEAHARELLTAARERAEAELAEAEGRRKGEREGILDETAPEDDAGLIEEKTVDDALVRSLRVRMEAIERAQKRLEEGTYGLSVESGEPIPAKRLEAIPWAERTKEEEER